MDPKEGREFDQLSLDKALEHSSSSEFAQGALNGELE